uniref:SICA antigen n=1 Tax=Globodera pallida TaxID=36090 RepID=A0A183BSF2_GLOPA
MQFASTITDSEMLKATRKNWKSCHIKLKLCVVLDGLNNILKKSGPHTDEVCQKIEECGGLDKIEHLQNHESEEIYKMAYEIIDNFFSSEEDDELVAAGAAAGQHQHPDAAGDAAGAPVDAAQPQFMFQPSQQNVPDEGFSFK